LLYVLGTAITYGIIGWIAGATGEQLQAYFQNIYAIGAISLLFVVMALSMFGLFEIQMPSFMQSRIQEKTDGMGGSAFMVFVLGIVSALIVGACVSPLLISVLSIALVQGDPVLGAAMMFIMALGMGVVLVLVGVGSSWLLPRAGMWMDYVKYAFGVMLIAVAIYLLGAIPAVPVQLLWAALLIVLSVYLGAIQPLPEAANRWRYFAKGVGIILLVWGVIGLLGGLQGNRNILHPLPDNMFTGGVASTNAQQNTSLAHAEFMRVKNLDELTILRKRAVMESKPLLLDYYADWCTDCIRMEETTFKDAGVINALKNYVLVQVDVTDPKDEDGKALKSEFNIYGPPATVIFGKDGKELGDEFRFYGYRSAAELLALLNKVET
ncbi:MAG: protein-disulfide reductase DsbD family protein, partial [Arenicellales bacterium WSBS_2016_MAG_OTU3]